MSSKYQVGDRVTIREWDPMAEEHGLYFDNSIRIPNSPAFAPSMEKWCGQTFKIRGIIAGFISTSSKKIYWYKLSSLDSDEDLDETLYNYVWSKPMFEKKKKIKLNLSTFQEFDEELL